MTNAVLDLKLVYSIEPRAQPQNTESAQLAQKIVDAAQELGANTDLKHQYIGAETGRPDHRRFLVDPNLPAVLAHLIHFGGPPVLAVSASAAFIRFLGAARDVILKFIEAGAGRSVAVQVGDTKVEIKGSGDLDRAVGALTKLQKQAPSKGAQSKRGKPTSPPKTGRKSPGTRARRSRTTRAR